MTRRGRAELMLAIASALAAAPGAASAQLCWWRTSLTRCQVLLLTETAVSYPLLNTTGQEWVPRYTPYDSVPRTIEGFHPELLWEVGVLVRLNPRTAMGPAFQWGVSLHEGESTKRFGVRMRRQQTRLLALEGQVGVITGHAGESGARLYPAGRKQGPTLEVSANLAELVSLGLRYDDLAWRDNGPEQRSRYPVGRARALSGVFSLGAKPSIPVNVALLAGLIVVGIGLSGVD